MRDAEGRPKGGSRRRRDGGGPCPRTPKPARPLVEAGYKPALRGGTPKNDFEKLDLFGTAQALFSAWLFGLGALTWCGKANMDS